MLSSMGMREAFSRRADFGAMTASDDIGLQDVLQRTLFEVDQEGARVLSASAAVMGIKGFGPALTRFDVDRPFVFMVRHLPTGLPVLLGRVVDPGRGGGGGGGGGGPTPGGRGRGPTRTRDRERKGL